MRRLRLASYPASPPSLPLSHCGQQSASPPATSRWGKTKRMRREDASKTQLIYTFAAAHHLKLGVRVSNWPVPLARLDGSKLPWTRPSAQKFSSQSSKQNSNRRGLTAFSKSLPCCNKETKLR